MSNKNRRNQPIIKELFSVSDKNAPDNYKGAYKMLSTNIEFIAVAQKCKNIMITSTLANEGKTNCVVNLALTLAGQGKKVCIVECDLRRPSIHRFLDTKRNTVGLTHVLKGEIELEKAVRNISDTNMSVLLAGMTPPNPSEVLASEKMQWVIGELEEQYDFIIYDTPPAMIISDAAVLGRYMDATFMVIKHNSTEKKMVKKAKANLENVGIKIMGVVLSGFATKKSKAYGGSYSLEDYSYFSYYGSSPNRKDMKENGND